MDITSVKSQAVIDLKAKAFGLALKCKETITLSSELEGVTGTKEKLIDERPVLEIAKEIYEWLKTE